MSVTIIGVQVGGRLLEIAYDMKMTLVLLGVLAYVGYRARTANRVPAKQICEATLASERVFHELLRAEEVQMAHNTKSTSPLNVRRKKKKSAHKQTDAAPIERLSDALDNPVVPPAAMILDDVDLIVLTDAVPVTEIVEVPDVVTKPKKSASNKKFNSPFSPAKDVSEINWMDVVRLPTKSSPGSTASTSSSSSSKARRSLSPVKSSSSSFPIQSLKPISSIPTLSINTFVDAPCLSNVDHATTKPVLSRSRSSIADGRSWRDVLGPLSPSPTSPPVLTKTTSLGTMVYPPLPKGPPPPLPATPIEVAPVALAQIVQQIEFYFSETNLQRDLFLRQRMDVHGFVYVNVVLNFNRVKAITQLQKIEVDLPSLIRALELSPCLSVQCKRLASGAIDPEFVRLAKIRPAKDWAAWVPANPLPTNHPFEMHANLAQLRRTGLCSPTSIAQTA
ncbi:hypothetical protein, variant [Aphanomyces invadans]|uniref:HTH La-type RNA-binding domain-containing protein n=1 Tax=Aphanomyces invadans TaxID=157072 RepID=A0A024UQ88_9STRA|nr:hypothetical protein, variant [Aphanomyces invadans]ETW07992.1 hypothetical protein, variant [Aphanomyces invadans]|eukprot:XP_008864085.1 hypothetical protein, variant [Aphanomyces invadans]